jgi:hypothetical protein
MSASSSVIMYSRGVLCAFAFLCAPLVWMTSLLVCPFSYRVALDLIPCVVSAYFCCTYGSCVLFFFPTCALVLDVPPFFCCALFLPVLGFLGTVISSLCVFSCLTSSSSISVGISQMRTRILHSSSQSFMAISMSAYVMQ